MSVSRQTAREAVERRLGINRTSGNVPSTLWSASEINDRLQEGYDDFCLRTGVLWKKDSPAALDDVASTATYTLPTEVLVIERCVWDSRMIRPQDRRWLEQHHPAFETQTGDVWGYLLEGDGLRILRKVNVPSTSSSTAFGIEYVRRGLALSDSQGFEIPDHMVKFIRFYALWKCLERDGPGQDVKFADHYQTRYLTGVRRALVRKSRLRSVRVGRMGGELIAATNGPPRPRLPWEFGDVIR